MNAVLVEARRLLDWAIGFGGVAGPLESVTVIGVGLTFGWIVLKLCVKGVGMPDHGLPVQLGALVVGGLSILGAAAAATVYVIPAVQGKGIAMLVHGAAPVLGFLVVGVPVSALMLRGGYGKTLSSLFFASLGFAVSMFAAHLMFGSFRGEYQNVNIIRDRTEFMDKELNRK